MATCRKTPATAKAGAPLVLGPKQETLLIPLYGRAVETRKEGGMVSDPMAVAITEQLAYDFSKWDGAPSLVGSVMRTLMFDQEVREFLSRHPAGTVIELGCGLNTRYERLDNGQASWIELDLPDVIELRRRYFSDTDRRRMLVANMTGTRWLDLVEEAGGPWCFVAEASIIYLTPEQVRRLMRRLARRFPGAWMACDTVSSFLVQTQDQHDAMRHLGPDSWFLWGCDDPGALGDWGLRLERSRSFDQCGAEILSHLPWDWSVMLGFLPWLIPHRDDYRINRFTLAMDPPRRRRATGAPSLC